MKSHFYNYYHPGNRTKWIYIDIGVEREASSLIEMLRCSWCPAKSNAQPPERNSVNPADAPVCHEQSEAKSPGNLSAKKQVPSTFICSLSIVPRRLASR